MECFMDFGMINFEAAEFICEQSVRQFAQLVNALLLLAHKFCY